MVAAADALTRQQVLRCLSRKMADGLNGAVKAYLRRMLAECGAGMKALLLDASTVRSKLPELNPALLHTSAPLRRHVMRRFLTAVARTLFLTA